MIGPCISRSLTQFREWVDKIDVGATEVFHLAHEDPVFGALPAHCNLVILILLLLYSKSSSSKITEVKNIWMCTRNLKSCEGQDIVAKTLQKKKITRMTSCMVGFLHIHLQNPRATISREFIANSFHDLSQPEVFTSPQYLQMTEGWWLLVTGGIAKKNL
jgi:hypothetical protein